MYRDPVVEELRENATKLLEECEGDLHKLVERLRREQAQHADRVVRRRFNRPPTRRDQAT